jgi:hypothetical protein
MLSFLHKITALMLALTGSLCIHISFPREKKELFVRFFSQSRLSYGIRREVARGKQFQRFCTRPLACEIPRESFSSSELPLVASPILKINKTEGA